jgi:hypothetical protein
MRTTLCTTAAVALLATAAIFASFEDAQARGFGRGGAGIHRMNARGLHSNHVNRAPRLARANVMPRGNARLRTANRPGIRQAPLKQMAGVPAASGRLNYGPQKQQPGVYRQMAPGNTPQANNTPPKMNGGSAQPQGNPGAVATGPQRLPKDHIVRQGSIPIWISKPLDSGITHFVPVYGPVKTTYDTYQNIKPKIQQTLQNSELSNKLHEEAIKAEEEAAKARKEQGGGVFQPSGLNDPSLMDP